MKKIVVFLVSLALIFNIGFATVAATTDVQLIGEFLRDLKLYRGYEDGSLGLERNITRAEFATLAVRIVGKEGVVNSKKGATAFKDVSADFWASGYVNVAVEEGLIQGYTDGRFQPQGHITYAETLAVLIRILGYEDEIQGSWPNNYINKAKDLGITKGVQHSANKVISRGDIGVLIYNSLLVNVKP
ncbi:MAG: S-layer homology domain-containing protein [Clostridiaceae bacterium]|nr:S-layer homology domain-containing protein [Clostridiaceae bacterium]